MAQFGSYPVITTLADSDKLMVHQASSGAEKLISVDNASKQFINLQELIVIADLRAKSVASLPDGTRVDLSGYYAIGDGGGGVFFYDLASSLPDNGGTVIAPAVGSGRWVRPTSNVYNVIQFGAVGDGSHNDTTNLQSAITEVSNAGVGSVYLPAGNYKITQELTLPDTPACNISLLGDGPNVSIITQATGAANGLNFNFVNVGVQQPNRVTIENLGFKATVDAGIAIRINYGTPVATSNHFNMGPLISNCSIKSDEGGTWHDGIDFTSAANFHVSNTFISGNTHGSVWTDLAGAGIRLRGLCVNSHIENCQICFFFTGIYFGAAGGGNTEGLFCVNNSMVAVRRGVWIQGNPFAFPGAFMTGFQMTGGLIETRSAIYAIDLEACGQASINGVYMIDGAPIGGSAGIILSTCQDISIKGNQFYAYDAGIITDSNNEYVSIIGNLHTGGGKQVHFGANTTKSMVKGTIIRGAPRQELNDAPAGSQNKIYQAQDYGFGIRKSAAQAVITATEEAIIWGDVTAIFRNDLDFNLVTLYRSWNPANPTRITIPQGVNYVRLKAGCRWEINSTGYRSLKIRGSDFANYAADNRNATVFSTDAVISTPVLDVATLGITYFDIVVEQTSGGNLNILNEEGTFVEIEFIG